MSDVNYQLVREFFELNLFNVLTHWQQDTGKSRAGDHGHQLFVENCDFVAPLEPLGTALGGAEIRGVERAVVDGAMEDGRAAGCLTRRRRAPTLRYLTNYRRH